MKARFLHNSSSADHPADGLLQSGIMIVRPTPSQRLRFGDFGRRLAPSGEVLAWLIAKGTWDFDGKRVLELGSGLGLPGMACAAWTNASYVSLTDGDPELVDALRSNIALNAEAGAFNSKCQVRGAFIDWMEKHAADEEKFDVILCADCVYDVDLHVPLLLTLRRFLRPDGKVILMASPRGGSLHVFLGTARAFFGNVCSTTDYDDEVNSKLRGQKCFPHLVLLDVIEAASDEDFSILDDEVSKRHVERCRRALEEEEERARMNDRYKGSYDPNRTLNPEQINSFIERMSSTMRSKTRGREHTDDLRPPVGPGPTKALASHTVVARPRTTESQTSWRQREPELMRQLRESVRIALSRCHAPGNVCKAGTAYAEAPTMSTSVSSKAADAEAPAMSSVVSRQFITHGKQDRNLKQSGPLFTADKFQRHSEQGCPRSCIVEGRTGDGFLELGAAPSGKRTDQRADPVQLPSFYSHLLIEKKQSKTIEPTWVTDTCKVSPAVWDSFGARGKSLRDTQQNKWSKDDSKRVVRKHDIPVTIPAHAAPSTPNIEDKPARAGHKTWNQMQEVCRREPYTQYRVEIDPSRAKSSVTIIAQSVQPAKRSDAPLPANCDSGKTTARLSISSNDMSEWRCNPWEVSCQVKLSRKKEGKSRLTFTQLRRRG